MLFSKEGMKVKKVSNLNLLDTCVTLIHVSRTIKEMNRYPLQLADTIGTQKFFR